YDSLVRMAQGFSMRSPLVDGQGNFGSIDGDPAAAMRYTEARMSPISEELLADIKKDTVDFKANYDDRLEEPEVLPSAIPNLLVNGSSGIAVGMSTNIPPHNLKEVIDATIHLIDNPSCAIPDLMEHIKGPDFPTGANIVGREAIHSAYTTGRGRLRVRAEFEREEEGRKERIVITELPFQQNKSRLVERIAENVNDGKIEGISDLRDESDRDGIRIAIDLKRGANIDVVENQLLEHHLERTFGVINLALVDGQPQVLDLKETVEHYVSHRKDVVRRRSEYDLAEAEDRAHILEGRLTALDNVDSVVELIREADDRESAKDALKGEFEFSDAQSEHIVRMQLGSLTSLEREEIDEEYGSLTEEIERLETILAEESELLNVIKDELRKIRAEYGDDRRTKIIEGGNTVLHEDLIPEEDSLILVTEDDYVKRMPTAAFDPQGRGGKGIIGANLKEGDHVSKLFRANTHDYLLCFTNYGKAYQLRGFDIPEMSRTARGKSAVNILDLDRGEELTAVVNTDDFSADEYLTMVTERGYVKRTDASAFERVRSSGLIAASLEEGDRLVDVTVTDGTSDILIATENGMAIRFSEGEARPMGRTARGVNGIKLQGDDAVVGLVTAEESRELCTITENGYGKRTSFSNYRTQSRYGKGLIDIKTGDRNGRIAAIKSVSEDDDLVLMSNDAQIMRIHAADISTVGRNTMGVTVMRLAENDRVASVDMIPESQ
ncbi:MAG: DNA gyrase subunit A, partial [Euryarchaeota archaeon]|nr:DNA gyrase subunit A [Euryarchaeota archaeon]